LPTLSHSSVSVSLRPELAPQLALAAQAAGFGVWDWDLAEDISRWDERAAAIHGCEAGASTRPYDAQLACAHPDDLPRLIRARLDAIETTGRFDLEYRILRADGAVRQLRSLAEVLRDPAGNPVRMVGVVLDVTGENERQAAADQWMS